jgi:hypothetical protein
VMTVASTRRPVLTVMAVALSWAINGHDQRPVEGLRNQAQAIEHESGALWRNPVRCKAVLVDALQGALFQDF